MTCDLKKQGNSKNEIRLYYNVIQYIIWMLLIMLFSQPILRHWFISIPLTFFGVFRGCKNGTLAWNGLFWFGKFSFLRANLTKWLNTLKQFVILILSSDNIDKLCSVVISFKLSSFQFFNKSRHWGSSEIVYYLSSYVIALLSAVFHFISLYCYSLYDHYHSHVGIMVSLIIIFSKLFIWLKC